MPDRDFPSSPVAENLPSNEGTQVWSLVRETKIPRALGNNQAHVPQLLHSRAWALQLEACAIYEDPAQPPFPKIMFVVKV